MTIVQEFEEILRRQADAALAKIEAWRERREEERREQEVQKLRRRACCEEEARERVRHAFYDDFGIFSEWKERTDDIRHSLIHKLQALYRWAQQTGRPTA